MAIGSASLDGFGPLPSFSIQASDSSQVMQKAPIPNTPLHQILAKADSLSPPKRSTANRAKTGGHGQRKLGGQLIGNGAASSAEALASTIAYNLFKFTIMIKYFKVLSLPVAEVWRNLRSFQQLHWSRSPLLHPRALHLHRF